MVSTSTRLRRRVVGLVLTAALVAGTVTLVWLTAHAGDAPAPVLPESQAVLQQVAAPGTVQNTDFSTPTAFLPFVGRNYLPTTPVFGVELFRINKTGGLAQIAQTETHWVRFRTFLWDEIEPTRTSPPTYLWNTVDEASLLNASANGLEVIGVVHFAPLWAQLVPGEYCGPFKPDALDEFAQFVHALVARYSVDPYNVAYWELGNEPDLQGTLAAGRDIFGCWGDAYDEYYGGGYYAEMLKVAYPAIKAADPHANVLIGGLLLDCDPRDPAGCANSAHGAAPPRFLEGILRNGGGPYFDIVSFHAYAYYGGLGKMGNNAWPGSDTAVPEKAQFIREVLQAYGHADKPLMLTEAALLCKTVSTECFETQAIYASRAYADGMAEGLQAQIYFAGINDHWYSTGLLNKDLSPKPVYNAFKTAASFLANATYQRAATGYASGVEGYVFGRKGLAGRVDVIWSHDGAARAVVLPAGATAYDRYGTPIPSAGGAIQVDYGAVYIVVP